MQPLKIKQLLKQKAVEIVGTETLDLCNDFYNECENPKAIEREQWLNGKNIIEASYIWRVGVLVFIDANKSDFVYCFIGSQRQPEMQPEFKGYYTFERGENDDIAAVIWRATNLMERTSSLFLHRTFDTLE
jgi:hypothetical protein